MNQPLEEAGTEKLCPHCQSWKVRTFMTYYLCYNDGCKKLTEPKDLLIREMKEDRSE